MTFLLYDGERSGTMRFRISVGSQGVHLLNGLQVNQALLANADNPIRGLTSNSMLWLLP